MPLECDDLQSTVFGLLTREKSGRIMTDCSQAQNGIVMPGRDIVAYWLIP
jgi:hypothetical protein